MTLGINASNSEIVDTIDGKYKDIFSDTDNGLFLYEPTTRRDSVLQKYIQEKTRLGVGDRYLYINLSSVSIGNIESSVHAKIKELLPGYKTEIGLSSFLSGTGFIKPNKNNPGTLLIDGASQWMISSYSDHENWMIKAMRDSNKQIYGADFRIIATLEGIGLEERAMGSKKHALYGSFPTHIYTPTAIQTLETERNTLLISTIKSLSSDVIETLRVIINKGILYPAGSDISKRQKIIESLYQNPVPLLYKISRGKYYIPDFVIKLLGEI